MPRRDQRPSNGDGATVVRAGLVDVAWDVSKLAARLDRPFEVEAAPEIESAAPAAMLDAVRDFLP